MYRLSACLRALTFVCLPVSGSVTVIVPLCDATAPAATTAAAAPRSDVMSPKPARSTMRRRMKTATIGLMSTKMVENPPARFAANWLTRWVMKITKVMPRFKRIAVPA